MRIGELARRVNLTPRTLRWYEACGLLQPARRNAAGQRHYDGESLLRLQHIVSMKSLGFSLDEIRRVLDRDELTLSEVVTRQRRQLAQQIDHAERLLARLDDLQRALKLETVSDDQLLTSIGMTQMFEKNYTAAQRQQLKARAEEIGPEKMQQAQQRWGELIAAVDAARTAGTDVSDPSVQQLAREWRDLVQQFSGGDADIERRVQSGWQQNPAQAEAMGLSTALFEYVGRAMQALDR